MNTRAIIGFSKPTFYQVLLCIISLLYYLPCASSQEELGWCGELFQCGNITAGFPFWGGKRPDHCGHTWLELHCNNNNSTSLIISDQEYSVLDVNQTSYSLTLARTDLLGPFCSAMFNTTTLPPDIFELSPTFKNLTVSYLCDPYPSSNFTCHDKGIVIGTVSQDSRQSYYCNDSFIVNVPMSFFPEEREFNLNQLERVLREGFEVKVEIDEITCQECSSSGGICSFNAAELHDRCSTPFICGYHSGLLYPFWIPGREECGHPDFKLTCIGGLAEVNIASVKFRILEANYTTRIIRLARSDLNGHLCPQNPSHAPLDQTFSLFSPDTELLTLYYGCGDFTFLTPAYDPAYIRDLGCDHDDEIVGSYFVTRNLSSHVLDGVRDLLRVLGVWCANVSVPASGPALKILQKFQTSDNLKKVVQEGVELGVDQECYMCIDSGGACGYNQTTRGFVCYCNNGPHSYICSSGKRNHGTITKILIGLSVLVAGVLVLLLILIPILRKRKASHDNRKQNLNTLIPLKHYSYAQVKRITNSFAEVVGEGGFGTVYRGTLSDGSMVAVKVLKDTKCNENYASDTSSMYFPEWIYKDLEKGDDERLVGNGISNDEEEIAKKMTLVGLWCIQSSPSDRPPMNRVVEMMEGNLDSLEVPPKPVWQIPTVPLPETSWISEESSSITN
ncbi:hypothetical protein YC2023_022624 [Brassica napus]